MALWQRSLRGGGGGGGGESPLPRLFAELLLGAIVFHRLLFPVPNDKLKFIRLPRGPRLMVKYVQMPVLRDGHQSPAQHYKTDSGDLVKY